jgi:hypothetical protein
MMILMVPDFKQMYLQKEFMMLNIKPVHKILFTVIPLKESVKFLIFRYIMNRYLTTCSI